MGKPWPLNLGSSILQNYKIDNPHLSSDLTRF